MAPSTSQISTEEEIATLFASIHAVTDARHAQVLQLIQDKGNQLRKTAIQEKGEAESARAEFREFHSFTKGLLAQGTPLEMAGTHKIDGECVTCLSLRRRCFGSPFFHFIFVVIVVQVQTRNETLEKLQFPKQSSVSPVFKFSPGNVEVKKAISTLGSILDK